jgi:Ca2+-binding RTX toxin-like protein
VNLPENGSASCTITNTAAPEGEETVTEEVGAGGTATTDGEADGAAPDDPVETSVTSPNAGTVTITETDVAMGPPAGFVFFGQQVNIEAPDASVADPLVLTFVLDASILPAGGIDAVEIFKDGVLVPDCTGAPDAVPDPCVASRTTLADGDGEIVVLTSTASAWNFGEALVVDNNVCDGLDATIVGTDGHDVIWGTNGDDVIVALGGNDIIFGRNGNDVICAGDGNDIVFGGSGNDRIFGGEDNDILFGGNGDDYIDGEEGNDIIFGENGKDMLFGGEGNDIVKGGNGNDKIDGGPGDDHIHGDNGNDQIDGGPDTDDCSGGPGKDNVANCE